MWQAYRRRWIWIRSRATRAWRAMKRTLRAVPWSLRAGLLLLGLVAGAIWAFHAAGLLDVTGKDSSNNRFTAVLALVGVLVTASVAFLGHAINRQGEARQAVDSSIRAMGLLAKPDGSPAEPLTAGAGLLAVANLGQLDLAVSLLSDLWGTGGKGRKERVSRDAAITLIDQALSSRDPTIQIDAAHALHTNSERLWQRQPSGRLPDDETDSRTRPPVAAQSPWLVWTHLKARFWREGETEPEESDTTYSFPNFLFLRWDDSLPFDAKQKLAEAWVYFWTSAPRDVGHRRRTFLIGLEEIWRTETNPAIRNSVGLLLESALAECESRLPMKAWVRGRSRQVSAELTKEIETWRKRRKSHERKVEDLVELKDRVAEFVR